MPNDGKKLSSGKLIFSIFYPFLYLFLILLLSGDWLWLEGWLFGLWFLAMYATIVLYLYRKDPELLAERFKLPDSENAKPWDKYLIYSVGFVFLIWFAVMPLDAKRFEWTKNFPVWLKVAGGLGLCLSFFFLVRSFTDNTFLSPLIRIQSERNQRVVSTGVYGIVRHPMYLGAVLLFFGTSLLLGSKYGIALSSVMTIFIVVRVRGEEKMLLNELEGYVDYSKKVVYRLVPFIW